MSVADEVQIRPVAPDELARAAELFAALHAYNATFDADFSLSEDWREHFHAAYERARSDPDAFWTLAWHAGRAVGLLLGEPQRDPPIFRGKRWLELQSLYVDPAYRRHGVARLLVEALHAWGRQRGFDTIKLYVSAGNASARDFYARQGYTPLQEIWRLRL